MKFTKAQEAIIKRMMEQKHFFTIKYEDGKPYYVMTDTYTTFIFNKQPDCLTWDENPEIEKPIKEIETMYTDEEQSRVLAKLDIDTERIKDYIQAKKYKRSSDTPYIILSEDIVFNAFYLLDCMKMIKPNNIRLFSIPGGYAGHFSNNKTGNVGILLPISVHYKGRKEYYQSKFKVEGDMGLHTWTIYHA